MSSGSTPRPAFRGRTTLRALAENFGWVLIGNLAGSLFVAFFLAVESGVVTADLQLARLADIATAKGIEESEWQIFLRAVGCNWQGTRHLLPDEQPTPAGDGAARFAREREPTILRS